MSGKLPRYLAWMVFLVAGSGQAWAGMLTLAASQTAYVRGGLYADDNFGGGNLLVKNSGGDKSFLYNSWMQFDTSSFTNVSSVSLNMNVLGGEAFDIVIRVYGVDDDSGEFWDESTLTYQNAPGRWAILGQSTVTGSTTGSWSEFAFTDNRLRDFLNADTNGKATLILTADTVSHQHGVTFAPDPVLRLQAQAVPEPSSLAVISFACLFSSMVFPRYRRQISLTRLRVF
ncbi:MAG: DNRLRE domain-containing protein [Pirellulaceae bacterium]